jgi:hypothetical protein
LLENDYAVIHLGKGNHKFIKGIDKLYHKFEPIEETLQWQYKRSILNGYNTSESNALSVANNQRILHHFLFGKDTEFDDIDILKRPKTYFPHRTKTNLSYCFGEDLKVDLEKIQIEIDLTIEFQVLEFLKQKMANLKILIYIRFITRFCITTMPISFQIFKVKSKKYTVFILSRQFERNKQV